MSDKPPHPAPSEQTPAPGPEAAAPSAEGQDVIELTESAADLVQKLTTERDEAVDGRLRALADFRNFQRRAAESEQRALGTGAARVVRGVLPVLDHFDLALAQNTDQMTVQQLVTAVKIIRDELNKAMAAQGVEKIAPNPGEPFDPHKHEAVMRQPVAGAAPDSIASTLQAGYAMGELVLRPAKVGVTPGND
jgi:molecular chaperone GrpE